MLETSTETTNLTEAVPASFIFRFLAYVIYNRQKTRERQGVTWKVLSQTQTGDMCRNLYSTSTLQSAYFSCDDSVSTNTSAASGDTRCLGSDVSRVCWYWSSFTFSFLCSWDFLGLWVQIWSQQKWPTVYRRRMCDQKQHDQNDLTVYNRTSHLLTVTESEWKSPFRSQTLWEPGPGWLRISTDIRLRWNWLGWMSSSGWFLSTEPLYNLTSEDEVRQV